MKTKHFLFQLVFVVVIGVLIGRPRLGEAQLGDGGREGASGVVAIGETPPIELGGEDQEQESITNRYFTLELREDDTTAITDRYTNTPYYPSYTYYGPSDAEWLQITGGSGHVINGSVVTIYNIQGSFSLTYRSEVFATRTGDNVSAGAQPWSDDPFNIDVSLRYPTWYHFMSATPGGYSLGTGKVEWDFFNVTAVSFAASFNQTGGQRPLLDLPVDYVGRSQGSGIGFGDAFNSRITSMFDHRLPNYSLDGKFLTYTNEELADPPGVNCRYGFNCYDGHNGYDFDDACRNGVACPNPSTVFSAATGTIVQSETGWTTDGLGCRITVDHGNGWRTVYGHLRDSQNDHSCDGILRWSGSVQSSVQIGIIGTSGNSTGTHLHFSVLHNGLVVDPSGWESGTTDPWTTQSGAVSYPLWKHAIRTAMSVPLQTGGMVPSQYYDVLVDVPTNYYNTELVFTLAQAPVANSASQLAITGHSFWLNARTVTGSAIHQLNQYLTVTVHFTLAELGGINPETLALYRWDDGLGKWTRIPTVVDLDTETATAQVNHLSLFALMGTNQVFLPVVVR